VGTKAWIVYGIICVVVIATVLVMMLVLVPQATSTGLQAGSYEALAKQEFTFDGSEIDTLKKQYGVTQSDVDKGLKTDSERCKAILQELEGKANRKYRCGQK